MVGMFVAEANQIVLGSCKNVWKQENSFYYSARYNMFVPLPHTVYVSRDIFLRLCDNRSPGTSRTLLRALAEYKMALFCSSTVFVSMLVPPQSFLQQVWS